MRAEDALTGCATTPGTISKACWKLSTLPPGAVRECDWGHCFAGHVLLSGASCAGGAHRVGDRVFQWVESGRASDAVPGRGVGDHRVSSARPHSLSVLRGWCDLARSRGRWPLAEQLGFRIFSSLRESARIHGKERDQVRAMSRRATLAGLAAGLGIVAPMSSTGNPLMPPRSTFRALESSHILAPG